MIGTTTRIVEKLLRKPFTAEQLNTALKDDSWHDIQEGLEKLLKSGVIAVTNKRFWLRDRAVAMQVINGQRSV